MSSPRAPLPADIASALGVTPDAAPREVLGMGNRPLTAGDVDACWRRRMAHLSAQGIGNDQARAALSPARQQLMHALGVTDDAVVLTPLDLALRDALSTGRGWDRRTRRRVIAAAHRHGLPIERLPRVIQGLARWLNAQRGTTDGHAPVQSPVHATGRSLLMPVLVIAALMVVVVLTVVMSGADAVRPNDVPGTPQAVTTSAPVSADPATSTPAHTPTEAAPEADREIAAARDRLSRPGRAGQAMTLVMHGDDARIIRDAVASLGIDTARAWDALDATRREATLAALSRMLHVLADRPGLLDQTLRALHGGLGDDASAHQHWSAWIGALANSTSDPTLALALARRWPARRTTPHGGADALGWQVVQAAPVDPPPLNVESWRSRWRHLSRADEPETPGQLLEHLLAWRLLCEAATAMVIGGQDASVHLGRLLLIEDRTDQPGPRTPSAREDNRLAPVMKDMSLLMRDRVRAVRDLGRDRTPLGPRDAAALVAAALGSSLELRREAQKVILSTQSRDPLVVRSVLDAWPKAERTTDVSAFAASLTDDPGRPGTDARQALLQRVLELEAATHQGHDDALQAAHSASAEATVITGTHLESWPGLAQAWTGGEYVPGQHDESPAGTAAALERAAHAQGRWLMQHGLASADVHRVLSGLSRRLRSCSDAVEQVLEIQRTMGNLWHAWFERRGGLGA